jgi:prepilin-type N-terminal cleavage/methylation domain-containing protein
MLRINAERSRSIKNLVNKMQKNGFTPLEIINSYGQNNMQGKKPKQGKSLTGFTLIEIVVVIGIFSLLISSLSLFFVQALQSQRNILATQEVLGQASYVLDYMSRAARMARKDIGGSCTGTAKLNYSTTTSRVLGGQTFLGPGIKFLNYDNICQEFFLDSADLKLKESKSAATPVDLTSAGLKVNSFNVALFGETQGDNNQPKATLFLDIKGKNQSKIKIQTTVSQRNMDIAI